jgi:hypothetical protein
MKILKSGSLDTKVASNKDEQMEMTARIVSGIGKMSNRPYIALRIAVVRGEKEVFNTMVWESVAGALAKDMLNKDFVKMLKEFAAKETPEQIKWHKEQDKVKETAKSAKAKAKK